MGGILQGEISAEMTEQRVAELLSAACDYNAQTFCFPVRHHSPACSCHLKKVAAAYRPDCILIEGPSDANDLIDILSRSKAPLAVYCSFSDKKGAVSDEKEDYKCYYPFIDCSPELVALREAARLGIHAEFIDLPYCDILRSQAQGRGLRREETSYNDDYLLARSRYINRLCEKLDMRGFDELWEKYFETAALRCDTEDFLRRLLTYCLLSRDDATPEELAAEGTTARETFMAQKIRELKTKYERILVVTGGYHTCALPYLIANGAKSSVKLLKNDQRLFPVAYSSEAADAASGYASGMPSPAFYTRVWRGIENDMPPEECYRSAVLDTLVAVARRLRGKGETISAYDEMCAYDMALGLASLRGKAAPGLWELRDSVLSCFVKGECCISTDLPLRILAELTTGSERGELCEGAPVPPILSDFEAQCKRFGLKTGASVKKELTLDVFSTAKHRETAAFFHRLCFIDVPFAKCVKGIDLRTGKNRNLIREVWEYKWNVETQPALIDNAVGGSTVEEACVRQLEMRLEKAGSAKDGASLTVSVFEMGIDESVRAFERLEQLVSDDGSFASLAEALAQMVRLSERSELYRISDTVRLDALIRMAGQRLVSLVTSIANASDEDAAKCAEACVLLNRLSNSPALEDFRAELLDAFARLSETRPVNPLLEGTAHGLLYGADAAWRERIIGACEGYFSGTGAECAKSVAYLRGLFSTARDLVLTDGYFVVALDRFLASVDDGQFMELLPGMRLAFGCFTPSETDRVAGQAARLHGAEARDIMRRTQVQPALYTYARGLDALAKARTEGGTNADG